MTSLCAIDETCVERIVASTTTPSTRRLLDGILVDFHAGRDPVDVPHDLDLSRRLSGPQVGDGVE
tara:strand:+ start:377 stop:571 length:195 start_codon:yes stop_codon:yes gene_type:complete